ncbi:lysophospholipid acyltransferase family protein [Plastorhodobacter daqingensis]|uniref:Lysophospholipid acyltransferase family protein n=1 Tax=Plastorhodobacter daqingensis TaxID=1387281 RepID=A0ABW2UIG7_9RHOB
MQKETEGRGWGDWLSDRLFRGLIWLALRLPHGVRVRLMGWMAAWLVAPLAGYIRRAEDNLALVFPDMPPRERRRIARAVANNTGRMLIENYASQSLVQAAADHIPLGPGYAALQAAQAAGRPAILVTGHFGNFGFARAALTARGFEIAGLYRPMRNVFFNEHYVRMMESVGGQSFPQGRRGTAGFARHLRDGGTAVLLIDQHISGAPQLDFLGHPARTALSAAELALKYDALLIPFYATRQPDGLSFVVEMEAPVPHGDPVTMTQALNDSLAARVRNRPEQWFWIHRRWKA